MKPKEPSLKQLREMKERFEISEDSVVVKKEYHKSPPLGSLVGSRKNRYYSVSVIGRVFYVHHIVWFLSRGVWPEGPLDHIDGNKYNNKPENLRLSCSKSNQRSFCSNYGSLPYRGVYKNKGRYMARVKVNGKELHLGSHGTVEEAAIARDLYVYEELGWPWEGLSVIGKWAVGYYHQSYPEKIDLEGF